MSFAELKGICKSPSDHIEVGATVIVDGNQYEVTSKIGQYKGKKNNTRANERSLTVKENILIKKINWGKPFEFPSGHTTYQVDYPFNFTFVVREHKSFDHVSEWKWTILQSTSIRANGIAYSCREAMDACQEKWEEIISPMIKDILNIPSEWARVIDNEESENVQD